ncbi:MAG: methyltransferase, partial [Actinomycetota bacterium]
MAGWRRFVPASVRTRLRPVRRAYVDWRRRRPVDLGDLRRVTPIDPNWGFERGTPIDRVYVETFISAHAADIRGRVL